VERGRWCGSWSITPHTKFKAEAYVLTKEEGVGTRRFLVVSAAVLLQDDGCDGVVTLPEGVEMVMPGDNVSMEVHLIMPIAMEKELRFAIREGSHGGSRGHQRHH